jgi:predicted RecA/RadA family phage recombinase
MAKTFQQEGRYWPYTTTGAVAAGDVKVVGTMAGVALDAATGSNQLITLDTEGVYVVKRTAAATLIAKGANVYFTSAGAAVATATGNVWGGKLWEAVSPTGSTTCKVALNKGGRGVV